MQQYLETLQNISIFECLLLHTVNNIKLASEVTQSLSAVVPQGNIVILPLW